MTFAARAFQPRGWILAILSLAVAGLASAGTCPVDLYREHDPGRPPAILTDPPATRIGPSPWLDPDPVPLGTGLTVYRLNVQTADPDPLVELLLVDKIDQTARLSWSGGHDPAACCLGSACSMLCPGACEDSGGSWSGPPSSCDDLPPPCEPSSDCGGQIFGLAKASGGGVSFGGSGYPTLAEVSLQSVDASTGAASPRGLVLTPEPDRPWNFTGARDGAAGRFYYAGGRADDAGIPTTVVAIDTSAPAHLSTADLSPPANLAHLELDALTGELYGLALQSGGITMSGGHHYFPSPLDLVHVSAGDGTVTTIATDLPGELDHFAATLDSAGGRYLYHTFSGELHAVDLSTGSLSSVAVPDHLAGLEWDEATRSLYGLRTCCATSFQASGDEGYRMFGEMELVRIDDATGAVTVLNPGPLPAGTTNWATALDCDLGVFLYVSADGSSNALDLVTGDLLSSSPPPTDARFHALD